MVEVVIVADRVSVAGALRAIGGQVAHDRREQEGPSWRS